MSDNLLDTDLGTVNTAMPLVSPDLMELKVEKAEIVATKDGLGKMLSLELSTTTPQQSPEGETISPGVRVFHSVLYTPKGKMTADMVKRSMGEVVQAAGMSVKLGEIEQWHKQLEGKVLKCRVIIEPERTNAATGETYRARNAVKTFLKA